MTDSRLRWKITNVNDIGVLNWTLNGNISIRKRAERVFSLTLRQLTEIQDGDNIFRKPFENTIISRLRFQTDETETHPFSLNGGTFERLSCLPH